jgi:hypothetical protein
MTRILLEDIAHARSGDKGDGSNVGVIAYTEVGFRFLQQVLTAERVKAHFAAICRGGVDRFEVPNLKAINFILHNSLGGGGSESVKTDAQGKTHGQALLRMELDLPGSLSLADLKPPPPAVH